MPGFGLEDWFKVLAALGQGGEATTYLARELKTQQLVALKVLPRPVPKVMMSYLNHEIQIQGMLGEGHHNIVDCRKVALTRSHLVIIMEYAAGGPLTGHISSRMKIGKDAGAGGKDRLFLSENEACYFFRQAISGIEYLHNHGVAHRDVKLDNALLDDSVPPLLKISDFGFAKGDAEINTFTFIGESVRPRRGGGGGGGWQD